MFFKTGLWHAQYITANIFKIGTIICRVMSWFGTIGFSTFKSIAVFNRIVDDLVARRPSWSLNSHCHLLSSSCPIIYQTKNKCKYWLIQWFSSYPFGRQEHGLFSMVPEHFGISHRTFGVVKCCYFMWYSPKFAARYLSKIMDHVYSPIMVFIPPS